MSDPASEVNWPALGRKLSEIMNDLVHRDTVQRYGDDFYGEALRRLVKSGELTVTERGRTREIPADNPDRKHGYALRLETYGVDWLASEVRMLHGQIASAEQGKRDAWAETRRVLANTASELAKWLRERTNERTVPAKFRREGVLLAADWLDPAVDASPYRGAP